MAGPKKASGRMAFNREKDLKTLQEHSHAVSGGRLVLAAVTPRYLEKHPGTPPYIVFWAAAWQRSIADYKSFQTLPDAQRHFSKLEQAPPPVTPSLRRDFQREKVYAWEKKFIDRHSPGNMTEEHIKYAIQKISDDFNLKAPAINLAPPQERTRRKYSYYSRKPYAFDMVSCKLTHAIHEKAHRIDEIINGNDWADHSPSFVRTIIRLAARYQIWQDPVRLEEEAVKMGILIAADDDLPPLPG